MPSEDPVMSRLCAIVVSCALLVPAFTAVASPECAPGSGGEPLTIARPRCTVTVMGQGPDVMKDRPCGRARFPCHRGVRQLPLRDARAASRVPARRRSSARSAPCHRAGQTCRPGMTGRAPRVRRSRRCAQTPPRSRAGSRVTPRTASNRVGAVDADLCRTARIRKPSMRRIGHCPA